MAIRIRLLGDDVRRRSEIAAALVSYLAGVCETRVASIGVECVVCDPDLDQQRPGFNPDRVAAGAELAHWRPEIVVGNGDTGDFTLSIDDERSGDVLRRAGVAAAELRVNGLGAARKDDAAFGTTGVDLEGPSLWKNILRYRYLAGCLAPRWFEGAWREPLFAFSKAGRTLLREGYSAGVMRAIYDRDLRPHGWMERVFLDYPLHRGIYDRLQILSRTIGDEIESRLGAGASEVRILSAPCGFADEVLLPLEKLAARDREMARRVRVVASDLDPHGDAGGALVARAARAGLHCDFVRGDLTSDDFRQGLAARGPFDIASFIGFSTWLPKPDVLRCFEWLHGAMSGGGVLLTDCATPAAFSLSGRYAGFKANYYPPAVYRVLLDSCGFDGAGAALESARDGINHVLMFRQPPGG